MALPRPTRGEDPEARRLAPEAFSVPVERYRLANGLVVLLAPDPQDASAAVWMSFRAGALHEPPGRAGMAHLVEHLLAVGPTPDTDYAAILQARRARYFNAETSFDTMTFEAVVPAEELPAALWATADRLTAVPPLLDDAVIARERRVVLEERALRDVDVPYGLFNEHVLGRVFPAPHPLHAGTIGTPQELARVGAGDVRRFVAEFLVPANAALIVAGRFDPAAVRRRIEELFGALPGGHPAQLPALPPLEEPLVDKRFEPLGRCPRVTVAWRFPNTSPEESAALDLGAQMLTQLTDRAWGMRLGAELVRFDGEDLFVLQLTVPYDESMSAVAGDAAGFLRQLTLKEMPVEVLDAANLALDRVAVARLDAVGSRAALLAAVEHEQGGKYAVKEVLGWHWELERGVVREVARQALSRPSVTVHARPTRPRPARAERE